MGVQRSQRSTIADEQCPHVQDTLWLSDPLHLPALFHFRTAASDVYHAHCFMNEPFRLFPPYNPALRPCRSTSHTLFGMVDAMGVIYRSPCKERRA